MDFLTWLTIKLNIHSDTIPTIPLTIGGHRSRIQQRLHRFRYLPNTKLQRLQRFRYFALKKLKRFYRSRYLPKKIIETDQSFFLLLSLVKDVNRCDSGSDIGVEHGLEKKLFLFFIGTVTYSRSFCRKKRNGSFSFLYWFGRNETVTSFFPLQGRLKCNGYIVISVPKFARWSFPFLRSKQFTEGL
jgi:hypothetical protein